jgi:hypothetical protein
MRLYTEENVIEVVWMFAPLVGRTAILVELNSLRHIELPSDEEINKESFIVNPLKLQNDYSKEYYDDNIQYREEWLNGAKWVINHIKQQDNKTK